MHRHCRLRGRAYDPSRPGLRTRLGFLLVPFAFVGPRSTALGRGQHRAAAHRLFVPSQERARKPDELGHKRGLGLPAEDEEVEQGADDGVEETQDHGVGS